MRTTPLAAISAAMLLLVGCGDGGATAKPKPTVDPQTRAACQSFDAAIKETVRKIQFSPDAGMATAMIAELAKPKIEAAAGLAQEPVKSDLLKVVAAIDLFRAKAQEFLQAGYDHSTELQALSDSIDLAKASCRGLGVDVQLVVPPE